MLPLAEPRWQAGISELRSLSLSLHTYSLIVPQVHRGYDNGFVIFQINFYKQLSRKTHN